jgi:hypothetical protein
MIAPMPFMFSPWAGTFEIADVSELDVEVGQEATNKDVASASKC